MARILKEHDERLNELLNIAQSLFFQKGYEGTSVNDIIEKANVAKGTFYHYFKSKEDLLDKLVDRWTRATVEKVNLHVMKHNHMNALEKLNAFFITIRDFKMENLELMKVLITVLYKEGNLILRHKMFRKSIELLTPDLIKILGQGIREGIYKLDNVEDAAELIFSLTLSFGEIMVELLIEAENNPGNIDKIERKLKVYQDSIGRILGVGERAISIIDRRILEAFSSSRTGETLDGESGIKGCP